MDNLSVNIDDKDTRELIDESYAKIGLNYRELMENFDDPSKRTIDVERIMRWSGPDRVNELGGLDASQRENNRKEFGANELPEKAPTGILRFVWHSMQDRTLILLTIAAIVSFGIGIYEDIVSGEKRWIEGLAIIMAVAIVITVNSANDYRKELQFQSLSVRFRDQQKLIKVWSSKNELQLMRSEELVVGDFVRVEAGDLVPADGIVIRANQLACDESAQTGESEGISKERGRLVVSGSQVLSGYGDVILLAVGVHSAQGRLMREINTAANLHALTPMQAKLNVLSDQIAKAGASVALLMLILLLIKYFVLASHEPGWPPASSEILQNIAHILIQAITIVVVSVPEGLPMAVTIALAYATVRMLEENNLVRVLSACETMGCATTICSDKTGTLTQNRMAVTDGLVLGKRLVEPISNKNLIIQSLVINSSVVFNNQGDELVGNKTECALVNYCLTLDPTLDITAVKSKRVLKTFPFSSDQKCSAVVVEDFDGERPVFRIFLKGASEIILGRCTSMLTEEASAKDASSATSATDGSHATKILKQTSLEERFCKQVINEMAAKSLRTICCAFQDLKSIPEDEIPLDNFTMIGILGIEDPLRKTSCQAVRACQQAGIFVRMVTGDNVATARAIATQCGILMPGGIVMEGIRFRTLSNEELQKTLPKLQVLARSTPADKIRLVSGLQKMGHIVAVTGDGTNDGPALKGADVGFAMGVTGTEVAKQASDIVLLDDNFESIVKAVSWGRCVREGVRKFLQFQLSVNISAVATAFVTALVGMDSVLSAVQLLWINLIMDTFAALALATDPPHPKLLQVPPDHPDDSLITYEMARMILGQSLVQLCIMLGFFFGNPLGSKPEELRSFLFNTFVFMQLFNEINSRVVDDKLNILYRLCYNRFFILIWIGTALMQVMLVLFGGKLFKTTTMPWYLWVLSVALGSSAVMVGMVIRLLPKWWKPKPKPSLHPTRGELCWKMAIGNVQKNLRFYNAIHHAKEFPN